MATNWIGRSSSISAFFMLCIFWYPISAQAKPDACSDALTAGPNGPFDYSQYVDNTYVREVLDSQFSKQTAEQIRENEKLWGSVPGLEDLQEVGFSNEAIQQRQNEIRQSLHTDDIFNHAVQISMLSGDKPLITAWVNCMKNENSSKGLYVRFLEPDTSTTVTGVIAYQVGETGPGTVHLVGHASTLPRGASISQGGECFQPHALAAGKPCGFTIVNLKANLPLSIHLTTTEGYVASGYMAPRTKFIVETKPFEDLDTNGHEKTSDAYQVKVAEIPDVRSYRSAEFVLSETLFRQGWRFNRAEPDLKDTDIRITQNPSGLHCDYDKRVFGTRTLEFLIKANNGHVDDGYCGVIPRASIIRTCSIASDRQSETCD